MSELDYRQFRKMVKDVAISVSRNYPSFIESQDVEGTLWLWLYEKREATRRTVEDNPTEWESMISATLRKVAFDHCAKEKAATEGFDPRDTYTYSLEKIVSLLPAVFDHEDWQSFAISVDPTPRGRRQVNESGDRMAELSDIHDALMKLPEQAYNALVWTYKYHFTAIQVGEQLDISQSAAEKRIQRAREALQRELGRKDPAATFERRTVRSNAAARAALSGQYDG